MNIFESAFKFLSDNSGAIGMVLGVLFSIAKVASNEKAGVIVAGLQKSVDFIAKLVSGLGSVLVIVSDFLANLIKSDGILGRK